MVEITEKIKYKQSLALFKMCACAGFGIGTCTTGALAFYLNDTFNGVVIAGSIGIVVALIGLILFGIEWATVSE